MAEWRISETRDKQQHQPWRRQVLIKRYKRPSVSNLSQIITFLFYRGVLSFSKVFQDCVSSLHLFLTHCSTNVHVHFTATFLPYQNKLLPLTQQTLLLPPPPPPHCRAILRSTDRFDIFCCANTEDGIDR